jgi:hypothetical protein
MTIFAFLLDPPSGNNFPIIPSLTIKEPVVPIVPIVNKQDLEASYLRGILKTSK